MRVKQELTLQQPLTTTNPAAAAQQEPTVFFSALTRNISKSDYCSRKSNTATPDLDGSSHKTPEASTQRSCVVNPGNAASVDESLKLSYIILNEHISDTDAFRLLGRLVSNVKNPLQAYVPAKVIPGAEIPALQQSYYALSAPNLERQSSSSSTVSSTGTMVEYGDYNNDFREKAIVDIDPSLLVFRNLPYSVAESTSATLSHSSHYTRRSESLLTSLLGLSIQSSKTAWKEFKLESKLIRTISLSQHNLVWSQLLKYYKPEIMAAVRQCGGIMFLVIGVKVARDAEVEVKVAWRERDFQIEEEHERRTHSREWKCQEVL